MVDNCYSTGLLKASVCHFSTKHGWDDTRIFYSECCSLQRAGYDVTYIVAEDQASERNVSGVKVVAVSRPKSKLRRIFCLPWRLYWTIRRMSPRPVICHFHDPELMFVGKLLHWQGHHVVYDIHEIVAQQILDKPYLPRWLRLPVSKLYKCLERILTFSFAHVYVTEAPAHRPARSSILRNMPEIGKRPANKTDFSLRPFRMIYIGGVSRSRGAIEMLEVLRHLHAIGLEVELRILGWTRPPELREEMMSYLQGHGLENHCYISPCRVEPIEVIRELYESDIGLCLLKPMKNYVRAFPAKIFEYLRAGLPVVATDIAYWRPMVERIGAGIQVDISKPEKIAERIAELIDNPSRLVRMGRNGRKIAEQYWCWDKEQEYLLALYEDILSDGDGGLFAGPPLDQVPLDGLELDQRGRE
ncbi:MAG: glycosyltransferase [Sedimentisphaerales bacterium]|jgi:glycosyltransferase involved in cell wall biosynthesis|nr:glycosyltransferase [Sedimentisphaerales bacterium]